jgi:hypothetical protein
MTDSQGDEIIRKLEKKLKALRVPYDYVGYSPSRTKRFKIIIDGKPVHFGDPKATTFFDMPDENKRRAYIARHSKIKLKDGTRAIDLKYSPAWFSLNLLWS